MSDALPNIPNREVVGQIQIQNLLNALNVLTGSLAHTAVGDEQTGEPRYAEAAIAEETTLINTCERLDKIMLDDSRWTTEPLRALEEKLGALYDANRRLIEVRTAVEQQGTLPHVRYKPTMMKMGDGWAAIYGDPNFLDKSLVGYGETPEKALKCFDMIFDGTLSTDTVQWLTSQHEKRNLDGNGSGNTQDAEIVGEDGSGNSKIPPSDSPSSGPKD